MSQKNMASFLLEHMWWW